MGLGLLRQNTHVKVLSRVLHWLVTLCLFWSLVETSYAISSEQKILANPQRDAQPAESVVGKIVQAYGGLEKLQQINSASFKSHARVCAYSALSGAANCFDCDITGKGDAVRIESII